MDHSTCPHCGKPVTVAAIHEITPASAYPFWNAVDFTGSLRFNPYATMTSGAYNGFLGSGTDTITGYALYPAPEDDIDPPEPTPAS
jgi:hypothetical protein